MLWPPFVVVGQFSPEGKTMNPFRTRFLPLLVATVALFGVVGQTNAQALSDYLENKYVDHLLRAQAFTAPATVYVGLSTAACGDSSVGTEVTGGSYARVAITTALTAFAGTQSAGSTTASSGTGGVTSNNAAVNFPTPSAGWGTVSHWFLSDASTATSKTINTSDTVSFAIAALAVTYQ